MSTATITLNEKTQKKFSVSRLESFVNSQDFEDVVLGYHMIQGETGVRKSYLQFKKEQ